MALPFHVVWNNCQKYVKFIKIRCMIGMHDAHVWRKRNKSVVSIKARMILYPVRIERMWLFYYVLGVYQSEKNNKILEVIAGPTGTEQDVTMFLRDTLLHCMLKKVPFWCKYIWLWFSPEPGLKPRVQAFLLITVIISGC